MDFEADVEEETQREKGSSMEEKRNETIHVLAVDDNMLERKLLEKLLRVSSYQVTCVDSVDKALEYLGLLDKLDSNSAAAPASSQQQGLKVHLIMTDYCMPGMSGYDLLQRVKKSSWKDIPVVVMSSENVPSRIDMCLEGGAEEFLLKPVQLSDLQKLQPHLLKSINHQSCTDNNNNRTQNELLMVATEEENHNEEDNINDEISNNYITNNNSSSSLISKRKAISPEAPDRRAKLEGLAVL